MPAYPHLGQGLWLQHPHSPITHLHNGCLFIHYANGMGGKLGNKGRRKEKITLACFNILFISKHCGLQKPEPQSIPVPGILFLLFSNELSQGKRVDFLQPFQCLLLNGLSNIALKVGRKVS